MLRGMREPIAGTKPMGAYSPGIIAEGRFVYVAGQGPFRDGEFVPGTIEEETRLTIENLTTVLVQAGASLSHVVRCGVFLADVGDFAAMNAVYAEIFPDPKPARTTIGCALAGGIKVEIDCVAVLPH
jgi:2-iminobutanoate/2-iminopropanoate deaminase